MIEVCIQIAVILDAVGAAVDLIVKVVNSELAIWSCCLWQANEELVEGNKVSICQSIVWDVLSCLEHQRAKRLSMRVENI